jgi:tetratricopeptide (TPR) repeat protein
MNTRWPNLVLILGCLLTATSLAGQTAPPQGESAADLVKQGEKLSREGKQDEALALYGRALALSPNLAEAHLEMGAALDLKGEYAKARRHLAKAIELANGNGKEQALRAMAFSYAFEGKAQEAAKYEQQVIDARLARQDFTAAAEGDNEIARICLESGDLDGAYKWYKAGYDTALRKADMSDAEKNLWVFRWEHAQARLAARRGEKEEAQKHVAAAKVALDKANNPDQAVFFPYLTGYVAFYGGDYKTAIADLQKANQHDPFILSLLAQAYEKSGNEAQAMQYYRQVLTINFHNPTNAFARPLAMKKVGKM